MPAAAVPTPAPDLIPLFFCSLAAAASLHFLLHHASPHRGQRGKSAPGMPHMAHTEVDCMSFDEASSAWSERSGELAREGCRDDDEVAVGEAEAEAGEEKEGKGEEEE
jgi:hypothetical protein